MGIFLIALFLAVLLAMAYSGWKESRDWEGIYEGHGDRMGEAHALLGQLQAYGVKCRLRTTGGGSVGLRGWAPPMRLSSARVEVYKGDLHKARRVLDGFSPYR